MAHFVMVIEGVSAVQMKGILKVEAESEGHLKFIPLETRPGEITTRAAIQSEMYKASEEAPAMYKSVRLEWDDFGVASANQLLSLFSLAPHA